MRLPCGGTVTDAVAKSKDRERENVQAEHGAGPTLPAIAPGGFKKGVLLATIIVLPGHSTLLRALATDALAVQLTTREMLATVAVFAGLPALIVFGGIGRNLARRAYQGGISNARRGSLLGAAAGLGLVVLAAIPTATLPLSLLSIIATLGGAAGIGALAGGLLGLWLGRHGKNASASTEGSVIS